MPLGQPTKVSIGNSSVGTLVIDATTDEKHAIDVDTTDFPVEQGIDVTDHKRRKPDGVTLTGTITNTPVDGTNDPVTATQQNPATGQTFQFSVNALPPNSNQRSSSAYALLNKIADANSLFTVTTELNVYSNMALTHAEFPRDVKVGDSLDFTLTFKNFRVVQNQTVAVVVTRAPSGQPQQQKGAQAPNTATPQQAQSALFQAGKKSGVLDYVKNALQSRVGGGQ